MSKSFPTPGSGLQSSEVMVPDLQGELNSEVPCCAQSAARPLPLSSQAVHVVTKRWMYRTPHVPASLTPGKLPDSHSLWISQHTFFKICQPDFLVDLWTELLILLFFAFPGTQYKGMLEYAC